MSLETYREKRHFAKTPEPRGRASRAKGFSFVVQKHAASRLHYDFRLELDGVLLSWAVPKGPSLDPRDKRLAMQVEDHPLEYGGFEGTIPAGEYGAGTVMVWDRGTWEPEGDPREAYARGRLTFTLHGDKLRGKWHLVRTAADASGRKRWLLFKGADEEARRGDGAIVEERSESAKTGRSLDEIAAGEDTWQSNRDPPEGEGARFVAPELATLVDAPPAGDAWLHEIKLDGYRILARLARGKVMLWSRNGNDWTARMPQIERAVAALGAKSALLDGEVVALREDGVSDFQRLQNVLGSADADLTYFVFDLLELDGRDLRGEPLEARKKELARLLSKDSRVRLSEHVVGDGPEFFANACRMGLEGIVSKRRDAPYRSGRGRDWLKVKCIQRQELVVVGWTDPKSSRAHFGALLLAARRGGELAYVGKVGTGFSEASLAELAPRLERLARPTSPLSHPPRERRVHWVEPKLVAEVSYGSVTKDGILRHSSFHGLREDKPARDVVLERRVTNADKVLYPDCGVTKGEVASYLERVCPWILPHVAGRPLMLVRCPNGIGRCFVQKHADGKDIAVGDPDGLVGLAQSGALEIHTSGAHASDPDHPDLLVLDLDPDESLAWKDVVAGARIVRDELVSLGVEPFVKTTGGKGLHVCWAVNGELDWDEAKAMTREIAERIVRAHPTRFVATMSKARRKGKIYIDYLRNGRGATFVAPYSPRARPGAPVAMPLAWDELTGRTRPGRFTVRTAMQRLDALEADPWEKLVERWRRPSARKRKSTSRSKG